MQTREAPDFGGLCKNKNCAFSLRYLNFCPDVFGNVTKQLDNKAKFSPEFYDTTTWLTNNYNTFITQCLKK